MAPLPPVATPMPQHIAEGLLSYNPRSMSLTRRPVTSLGHQEGRRVFWEWPKFLNYVRYFPIVPNIFFQGRKFF